MNKTYRVIWNANLRMFQVVSELVKSKGKTKSSRKAKVFSALAISTICALGSAPALSADSNTDVEQLKTKVAQLGKDIEKFYSWFGNSDNNGIYTPTAEAEGSQSIALGIYAKAQGEKGIAIGALSRIHDFSDYSMALGHLAYVGRPTVVNPEELIPDDHGSNGYIQGEGTSGVDGGNRERFNFYHRTNPALDNAYSNSMAIGLAAKAFGYQSIAIGGTAQASSADSLAVGNGAEARGYYSGAFGTQAIASKNYALALGYNTYATQEDAIAIGHNATTKVKNGIALGGGSLNDRTIDTIGYDPLEENTKLSPASQYTLLNELKTQYENSNAEIQTSLANFQEKETAYYKLISLRKARFYLPIDQQALADTIKILEKLEADSDSDPNDISDYKNKKLALERTIEQWKKTKETLEAELNLDNDALNSKIESEGETLDAEGQKLQEKLDKHNKIASTWKASAGALAIGNLKRGITRQITGVAAGSEDTDAVNVAQLKALQKAGFKIAGNDYSNSTQDKLIKTSIGSILPIQGKSNITNFNSSNYSSDNLATYNDNGVLRIGMLNTPSFTGLHLGSGTDNSVALTVANGVLKANDSPILTEGNFKAYFTKNYIFEKGIKSTDGKDGKTHITLDKDFIKKDPDLKGAKGDDGNNGQSAYEIWKGKDGNSGKSEDEFLASLKGAKGDNGNDGNNGKSAFEIWKNQDLANRGSKTEKDFIDSLKGENGDNGSDGKSAYEIWKGKDGNNGKSEEDFLASLKGAKGDNGQDGTAGANGQSAFEIWKNQDLANRGGKTEKDFIDSLKGQDGAKGNDGNNGQSAFEIWKNQDLTNRGSKTEKDFIDSLKGAKGENGQNGAAGTNGQSAYEIWKNQDLANRGTKTEKDFIDSLKGQDGAKGNDGNNGQSAYEIWKNQDLANRGTKTEKDFIDSLKGENGDNGSDGKSAYEIWKGKDGNNGKSEDDFLASLKGAKGDNGQDGTKGNDGNNGKSAYEIWKGKDGNNGKSEDDFLASLKGAKGDNGPKGATGLKGSDGANGHDGKSAYEIWKEKPENQGKSKEQFIASLKGEKGSKGDKGLDGKNGESAYDTWKEETNHPDGSKSDFIASLKGDKGDKGDKDTTNSTQGHDSQFQAQINNHVNQYITHNSQELHQLKIENENLKTQVRNNHRAINELDHNMQKIDHDLRAGIAGSTAMSFLQSAHRPGESAISAAASTYRGENAVAIGYSRLSDNNHVEIKLGAAVNSRSDVNAGGSIGYHW